MLIFPYISMQYSGFKMWFNDFVRTLSLSVKITAAAIGFGTLVFFFQILQHKRRRNSTRLPPGPCPWPIIGNLHQLSLPAHRALKNLAEKYGPVMFLRFGSIPTVVVSSSEMAKHFLRTHDLVFANRPPTTTAKYLSYDFKGLIATPYGDYWKYVRKICVTELLTPRRIEFFKDVREEEVSAMIHSIWGESESGTIAVNVSNAFFTLTTNIIWRMLVRKKFCNNDLGSSGERFRDLVLEGSAAAGSFNIGNFVPSLDWLDLQGNNRRIKKANKIFDAFVEKVIDDHMDHGVDSTSNGQTKAKAEYDKVFVDVLLQIQSDKTDGKITRETIKAIMFDMFAAGMETTAITLEWAMSELLRHPHAMKRLQEEIECTVGKHAKVKESEVASMKYLHSVVRETLRLYPPGPLGIPRESAEGVTIGEYHIPKKTMLLVNLWAIGRDPNVWGKDASEFKPERFMEELGGHNDYTDITSTQDLRMLPFGAGRRGCPGAPMAIPTISLALAQLLHIFDWTVEGDPSQLDMKEAHAVSMPREIPLFAFPSLRLPLSCV
eukprot:PITA_07555